MGEGIADGLTVGLANMPPWVWNFILFSVIWLLAPWKHIQGIPSWAWIAMGVLAVWALVF